MWKKQQVGVGGVRRRKERKRGAKKGPADFLWRANEAEDSLRNTMLAHLEALRVRHYSEVTLRNKAVVFARFVEWCEERALSKPAEIMRVLLERYQRHLFYQRKTNGHPLSVTHQRTVLVQLRQYFRWLCHANYLQANPASELMLPRQGHRLPRYVLTPAEVATVLAKPDVGTLTGLRDRAMLEVMWATGLRRTEVVRLTQWDVNAELSTVFVREGKGKKDRVVPIGPEALAWVRRYVESVRSRFAMSPDDGVLFLGETGRGLEPDSLSILVKRYLVSAGLDVKGSCHLFRHACATAMMEGGADTRFVQELLGHASLETTQIYTRVSIAKLKAVYSVTHPAGGSVSSGAREADSRGEVTRAELLESLADEGDEESL